MLLASPGVLAAEIAILGSTSFRVLYVLVTGPAGGFSGPRADAPPDHPIRKVWEVWERLQVEPDQARRSALFAEIVALHREAPVAIGTIGEKVVPVIVKTTFRNVADGQIADDTLRDEGLLNPQQFFMQRS